MTERPIAWNIKPSPKVLLSSGDTERDVDFRDFQIGNDGRFDFTCRVLSVVFTVDGCTKITHRCSDLLSPKSSQIAVPGDEIRGEWSGGGRYLGMYILPSFVERSLEYPFDGLTFARGIRPSGIIEHLMQMARTDVAYRSPSGPMFLQTIAMTLVEHLIEQSGRMIRHRGGLSAPQLRRVKELIDSNLSQPLTLEELAHATGVSPGHFSRAFKTSTGLSPHRFIVRERVERARRLIAMSEAPLEAIAERVGFADSSHMATVFARVLGRPPSHFRNR